MKKILALLLTAIIIVTFTGCTEVDRVSYNISKEADNFNAVRRAVAINLRTDKILFECIGNISLSDESSRIVLTVQTGPNEFKKHFISKSEWVFWDIEDIGGSNVNKYRYEVNFLPEMLMPITITMND